MLWTLMALAALAATDGKTMMADDWHGFTILEVGGASPGASPYYLRVKAGDLDGDGRADEAMMKLTCADGNVRSAMLREIKGPRDSGLGSESERQSVKQWAAASPKLSALKTGYNVKKVEGSRMAADGWRPVSLSGDAGLCPAVGEAAAAIVKSKSNITNN